VIIIYIIQIEEYLMKKIIINQIQKIQLLTKWHRYYEKESRYGSSDEMDYEHHRAHDRHTGRRRHSSGGNAGHNRPPPPPPPEDDQPPLPPMDTDVISSEEDGILGAKSVSDSLESIPSIPSVPTPPRPVVCVATQ